MGTRNYDLIAIDLDGTLLGPDGRVSAANRAAIDRARTAGVEIVPATGRGLIESGGVFESIAHRGKVVVAGGAMTVDMLTGRTVARRVMDAGLIAESVEHVHAHGHAALVLKDSIELAHDYVVVRGGAEVDPITRWWFEMTGVRVRTVDTLDEDDRPDLTIRVGCAAIDAEAEPLSRQLQDELGDRAVLHTFSTTAAPSILGKDFGGDGRPRRVHVVEVFDAGAGKWPAVRTIAEERGIEPRRVAAIGDETNDVDMLDAAGLGIAMGNAVDAAAAVADVRTATNAEDGVARAIEKILDGAW
ncbi:MAG: HAD family hydrolase [Planctomycetota bacterium]